MHLLRSCTCEKTSLRRDTRGCKSMAAQAPWRCRGGANLASIFRTKIRPHKSEPQQLGFTLLGPFWGPENGPQNAAAFLVVSRTAKSL